MKIYKYLLRVTDSQKIKLRGTPLSVQKQYNEIVLYATYNEDTALTEWEIKIYGTGHDITANTKEDYLGTVLLDDGHFTWHIFAREVQ